MEKILLRCDSIVRPSGIMITFWEKIERLLRKVHQRGGRESGQEEVAQACWQKV